MYYFFKKQFLSGDTVVSILKKLFVNWDFVSFDANGFSGGLVTGWSSTISLTNSFFVFSGLCMMVYNHDLRRSLQAVNIYGPYKGEKLFSPPY
jgi:hypothetical protein